MNIDVPVRHEDGSIRCTLTLDDKQMQTILQFGVNFLVATGLAASYNIELPDEDDLMDDSGPEQGDLFN